MDHCGYSSRQTAHLFFATAVCEAASAMAWLAAAAAIMVLIVGKVLKVLKVYAEALSSNEYPGWAAQGKADTVLDLMRAFPKYKYTNTDKKHGMGKWKANA
ncbi:hypothetical protein TrLO_g12619 [Triparma laevis f. longispina]|uniref:Uncharacterized protein n=1 Tax=Triparma laevis f. longispina TaxID=1714387 RepID=A0A9W7ATA6_9STRA|nr:hypothetical protein TrLO_g12619 [Triparma laevis f. longispina]